MWIYLDIYGLPILTTGLSYPSSHVTTVFDKYKRSFVYRIVPHTHAVHFSVYVQYNNIFLMATIYVRVGFGSMCASRTIGTVVSTLVSWSCRSVCCWRRFCKVGINLEQESGAAEPRRQNYDVDAAIGVVFWLLSVRWDADTKLIHRCFRWCRWHTRCDSRDWLRRLATSCSIS